MKRFLVFGLILISLISFTADLSYGELYVICFRYGRGRCLKCKKTIVSGWPNNYDDRTLCHGVGKTFNTSNEAEQWRAIYCTCPGSK
jgi:hypothetical protein